MNSSRQWPDAATCPGMGFFYSVVSQNGTQQFLLPHTKSPTCLRASRSSESIPREDSALWVPSAATPLRRPLTYGIELTNGSGGEACIGNSQLRFVFFCHLVGLCTQYRLKIIPKQEFDM